MLNDLFFILRWWLVIFGLGILFFPLTQAFFRNFFDQGYAFSKIIGLLLLSYLIWLLGSFKILPFFSESIWLLILAILAFNYWFLRKKTNSLKEAFNNKSLRKIFLFEESLFLIALISWSFVRGFQPDIQGLEKFMDFGFVNSILKTRFFPPPDMWLAGQKINYYYFGHLVTAVLIKLSQIRPEISYNLMIASLFAFSFTAAFSLGGNLISGLVKKWRFSPRKQKKFILGGGLLASLLLTLSSNLHPLWWFFKNGHFKTYWYPDATRFIVQQFGALDNTIHEFPLYSFVVADLHGHLLNLPFVLLFLALMLTVIKQKKLTLDSGLAAAWLLGIFYITNAWDFPIYFLVLGGIVFYFNYLKKKNLFKTISILAGCFLAAIIFSSPFHRHFQPITKAFSLTDFHSPVWMLLVLWGFPLLISLAFLIFQAFKKKLIRRANGLLDSFVLFLLAVGWFLILIPEFFYVKDIYIHSYQRANTMFKLTYQAFVIFCFAATYVIINLIANCRKKLPRKILLFPLIIALIFMFSYPWFAVRSFYGLRNYRGLDGLGFLQRNYPDDYRAVLWLKENILQPVAIVEAVGESYTDFARVSALTGLPTVLGWRVHEWLWRGSFDEPAARTEDVREIYESSDFNKTKVLLEKYNVKLVFIGDLERKQYPSLQEDKFKNLGELVFSANQTKIYQLVQD